MDEELYLRASGIIKSLYGKNASFREGQYEAIEAVMSRRRVLLVRKTGWGKSLIYFACTKLLRERGSGVTVVVSPLLVLMQNQLEAARRLSLRCEALNSTVKDRTEEILDALAADSLDLVLITPETLFSDTVNRRLKDIRIGLFVIDEAHCISDWGHDFRLEYGNLKKIIPLLPPNVPLLATTATANTRVVKDLEAQLGGNVYISRGPLTRESLYLQILKMSDRAERYGWILENIGNLPGSGIIYCLTRRDCDHLAEFLNQNGVSAIPYYSKSGGEEENAKAIADFQANRVKAIVATIKLGMGYDKGDVGFVIHFQMPSNIVTYYQQIGRAGRELKRARVVLMYGKEDEDVINYFIETAFPTEEETNDIMRILSSRDGTTLSELLSLLNMRRQRLDKALSFLMNDGFAMKSGSKYYITPKRYVYDRARYRAIEETRRKEMEQMKALAEIDGCYAEYIAKCLDDETARPCGHCGNCAPAEKLPEEVSFAFKKRAAEYLGGLIRTIEPRKMWAKTDLLSYSVIPHVNGEGLCLCRYGEAGFGEFVKEDKYRSDRFRDELVSRSAEVLLPFVREHCIDGVVSVPSLRSNIVQDFAIRLAKSLSLPYFDALEKKDARPQKKMENSSYQCANAYRSFLRKEGALPKRALLVDDVVDSRWTLTVCGYLLMEGGTEEVYPFALADSKKEDG